MHQTWLTLFVLALLVQSLARAAPEQHEQPKFDADGVKRRHDYRQTFKKPFHMYDEQKIPFFEEQGNVIMSPDYVRLTPSVPDSRGLIWSTRPNPHAEWQVEFSFTAYGRGYMGGEGLAFWYTKDKGTLGPFFGAGDKWEGLAIAFDTGDQLENRYTPYVYGQMNHGDHELAHRKDYLETGFAGCFRDYRNTPAPVWARITYANQTIQLAIDMRQHGSAYVECFTHSDIKLPPNYYFGISAATEGHLADDHDVMSFEVYELNPKAVKHPERPHEAEIVKKEGAFQISDDVKSLIERIERKVDQAREQQVAREEPANDVLDAHAFEKLEGNQFHIIEALNMIQHRLGEQPISHDPNDKERAAVQHEMVKDAGWKMDDVIRRLTSLADEVKSFREHSTKALSDLQSSGGQASYHTQHLNTGSSSTPPVASSGHITAGLIGFIVGIFVSWVLSLVRRVGDERGKKFI
ncbi:hypothetical protein HDU88_001276 [Geranomyces variabilis]|nr:hypothetical protein HDU88_001276 [Geranomyces variabilis]